MFENDKPEFIAHLPNEWFLAAVADATRKAGGDAARGFAVVAAKVGQVATAALVDAMRASKAPELFRN